MCLHISYHRLRQSERASERDREREREKERKRLRKKPGKTRKKERKNKNRHCRQRNRIDNKTNPPHADMCTTNLITKRNTNAPRVASQRNMGI